MQLETGKYAIVTGSGRSGSNWLLSILDASRETHCRNEPHIIGSSPYHQLPDPPLQDSRHELMSSSWDAFAHWTANTFGERDHKISTPKKHLYSWIQKIGLASIPARPKVQKALRGSVPAFKRGEWAMPFWMGNPQKLSQAMAVFKLIDMPAWRVEWLLQHRSQIPVLHIIRHPGGFLNSGINRFFSTLTPQALEAERQLFQNRLKQNILIYPEWSEKLGDIESMTLIESVVWFWRFNNEMIYHFGKNSSNYLPIIYEEFAQRPMELAKEVYKHYDLHWTSGVEVRIKQGFDKSMWGKLEKQPSSVASDWKKKLKPEYQNLAQNILSTSKMACFWDL
jgi:hypothetical protein